MQIIERTEGLYEVQYVEFGQVYRWRPASVVVECSCGAKQNLTGSTTECGECGVDHTGTVREVLATAKQQGDEALRPWRYDNDREDAGLPV
jgi:hypothetical protein